MGWTGRAQPCPNCHYTRTGEDSEVPSDVCPNCKTAYARWSGMASPSPLRGSGRVGSADAVSMAYGADRAYKRTQRALTVLALALIAAGVFGVMFSGVKGMDVADIAPELGQAPQQSGTQRAPFTFDYMDVTYDVQPVAAYELWGLVVSHNDINSLSDAYHDKTSVDTKDLCVIWGPNVATDDFKRVAFESGSWTCYFRYPNGVQFTGRALSNNHVVTDRKVVRDLIDKVRPGDQVYFKGMLVNYHDRRRPASAWRRTSVTRTDTGNGACEVVFVEDMAILRRGTPLAYGAASLAWWALGAVLLLKLGLFARQVQRSGDGP